MVRVSRGDSSFYIDNNLSRQLDFVKKTVQDDDDVVFIICGQVRSGKSVLGMQLCKYLDPTFDLSKVAYGYDQFKDIVDKSKKSSAVMLDEATRTMNNKAAMSSVNKMMVDLMMECGQKNLFIVLCLPVFTALDTTIAVERSHGLFYVYREKRTRKRGYWSYYNRQRKNQMYFNRKKSRSKAVFPNFRGRFLNEYVVDETAYRKLKAKVFKEIGQSTEAPRSKYLVQRDYLFRMIHKQFGWGATDLYRKIKEDGKIKITRQHINKVLND